MQLLKNWPKPIYILFKVNSNILNNKQRGSFQMGSNWSKWCTAVGGEKQKIDHDLKK